MKPIAFAPRRSFDDRLESRVGSLKAQADAEATFAAVLKKAGLKLNLNKSAKKKAGKPIASKLAAGGVNQTGLAEYTKALPG